MIFRKIRRQLDGLLQQRLRLGRVADADRPARGVAIEQAQVPFGPGMVELRIQLPRRLEFLFHLLDERERAKIFRARKLAEVHRQIIMAGGKFRLAHDERVGMRRCPGWRARRAGCRWSKIRRNRTPRGRTATHWLDCRHPTETGLGRVRIPFRHRRRKFSMVLPRQTIRPATIMLK